MLLYAILASMQQSFRTGLCIIYQHLPLLKDQNLTSSAMGEERHAYSQRAAGVCGPKPHALRLSKFLLLALLKFLLAGCP